MLVLIEADVVEDEEFGFRAKVGGVAHAAVLQIQLGFFGDPARVALVVLLGDGVDDVAVHHDGGNFRERIHERRGGIGNQQHVAFVDRRPAANARAVHAETLFERADVQLAHRIGNMVLQAGDIGKPEIELLGVVLLGKFQHFLRIHPSSIWWVCLQQG